MFYATPQRESSHATSSSAFFGEQHTSSSFFNPVIQPKLNVNSPGDKYEQEADAMADKVSLMPESKTQAAPSIQRKCAKCEEEEKGSLMRKETNDGGFQAPPQFESKLADSKGSGSPMPAATQSFMENVFQTDFSGVRIHNNSASTSMSNSIQAKAFTNGNDIYFNSGQYNPHSQEGKHLLAHELTHTQQQGKAGGSLQREPAGGAVHSSMPTSVPFEKWGENVEQSYRRAGLTKAANGVQLCRVWGECNKLLTEHEVYEMYRSGRTTAGLGEPKPQDAQQASMGAAAAPLVAGTLRASAATAGALEGGATAAAATQGGASLTLLQGGATAATVTPATGSLSVVPAAASATEGAAAVGAVEGGATVAGASIATVAIPVALGAYIVVSVFDLFSYASFQTALIQQGFIILPSPLAVCIGNCHQPTAAKPDPWLNDPQLGPGAGRTPFPRLGPLPFPRLSPYPEDEDRRNGCVGRPIEAKFGRYPCHSDYATSLSGTRLEYQVTSRSGLTADFDGRRGDTLIEVKTGFDWLLNRHLSPDMDRRRTQIIARFLEQSIRQWEIAEECGYHLNWYFNRKAVADLMTVLLPHINVIYKGFDCDTDSDRTW